MCARDDVIDEIKINDTGIARYNTLTTSNKVKRDCVKSLFTILLYGGSIDTWAEDWIFEEDDYEVSDYVETFIEELKFNLNILTNVDTRFTDIVK